MKPEYETRFSRERRASLTIAAAGSLLLMYMIVVEDEPGAVPLFLIVSAIAWFIIAGIRYRRNIKHN